LQAFSTHVSKIKNHSSWCFCNITHWLHSHTNVTHKIHLGICLAEDSSLLHIIWQAPGVKQCPKKYVPLCRNFMIRHTSSARTTHTNRWWPHNDRI
jgi:hypothetical protein